MGLTLRIAEEEGDKKTARKGTPAEGKKWRLRIV